MNPIKTRHFFFIVLINLVNGAIEHDTEFNNDTLVEDGIFGPLLEKWTLSYNQFNYREQRVMKIPKTEGGFVASNFKVLTNETRPGKVVNRPNKIPKPQVQDNLAAPSNSNTLPSREVSETDLYLLGAVEKLAYKVDILEKRLRRMEEMMYFVVAGNKIDTEPCPDNFTRIGESCYFFGERKFNWQVASKYCKRMDSKLVEFEMTNEKNAVSAHIQSWLNLKGKDFWTSGLNPGLLWIWSSTAQPVLKNSDVNEILGTGRCLGLVYDPAYRRYNYRGLDCSLAQFFICEQIDKTINNEITRISKKLFN